MDQELARPAPVTRRRWIDILLGTSFTACMGAILYPVLRYLTPLRYAGGSNKATLTDAQKKELSTAGSLIARCGTDRVLLLKDKDGKLKALSAKCTHEGCTVQLVPADGIIWCACHNGKFSLDGRVLSGPPPRPLPAFTVEGDLKGVVNVTKPAGLA